MILTPATQKPNSNFHIDQFATCGWISYQVKLMPWGINENDFLIKKLSFRRKLFAPLDVKLYLMAYGAIFRVLSRHVFNVSV